jgi:hypothetical protein
MGVADTESMEHLTHYLIRAIADVAARSRDEVMDR